MTTTTETPRACACHDQDDPMLLNASSAAAALGISRSYFFQLAAALKVPAPMKLGRRSLWRRDELEEWVRAGCPSRAKWEAVRA